jgi:hypothetical protein
VILFCSSFAQGWAKSTHTSQCRIFNIFSKNSI